MKLAPFAAISILQTFGKNILRWNCNKQKFYDYMTSAFFRKCGLHLYTAIGVSTIRSKVESYLHGKFIFTDA